MGNLTIAVKNAQECVCTFFYTHHLVAHFSVYGHLGVRVILCKVISASGIGLCKTEFLFPINLSYAVHNNVAFLVDGCCIKRLTVPPAASVFHNLCPYATDGAQAQYSCNNKSSTHITRLFRQLLVLRSLPWP